MKIKAIIMMTLAAAAFNFCSRASEAGGGLAIGGGFYQKIPSIGAMEGLPESTTVPASFYWVWREMNVLKGSNGKLTCEDSKEGYTPYSYAQPCNSGDAVVSVQEFYKRGNHVTPLIYVKPVGAPVYLSWCDQGFGATNTAFGVAGVSYQPGDRILSGVLCASTKSLPQNEELDAPSQFPGFNRSSGD